jgi:hypothetical protein
MVPTIASPTLLKIPACKRCLRTSQGIRTAVPRTVLQKEAIDCTYGTKSISSSNSTKHNNYCRNQKVSITNTKFYSTRWAPSPFIVENIEFAQEVLE